MRSEKALGQITTAGEIKSSDTILEIGPGQGALTEKLLEKSDHVIAVEKDRELVSFLEKKFEKEIKEGKLKLMEGDILKIKISGLVASRYKLVANIPYNITGEIFRKFLQGDPLTPLRARKQPARMVLLVQKEVAERILARDGKESVLSISVKIYGEPKYIDTVKKGSFTPVPKVDSAILLIENISRERFHAISEENFFKILKAGFAHKRKLLSSNLKSIFKKDVSVLLEQCNIPEKSRAEDLKVEDWLRLARCYSTPL